MELDRCRGKGEESQEKESNGGSGGLDWAEGVVASWAGAVVLLPDSGEQRRGALLLGLVSLLSKSRASAASLASPTALPHFLLIVTSLVPSPPRWGGGGEMSKRRSLGCTEGVLVVCILS